MNYQIDCTASDPKTTHQIREAILSELPRLRTRRQWRLSEHAGTVILLLALLGAAGVYLLGARRKIATIPTRSASAAEGISRKLRTGYYSDIPDPLP